MMPQPTEPPPLAMQHPFRVGERVAYKRFIGVRVGTVRETLRGSCLVGVYWDSTEYANGVVREYGMLKLHHWMGLERVALVPFAG